MIISIDQNCHSLWDVVPKLHALTRRGRRVRQFIEDLDMAFASVGSAVRGAELRLARERFFRGGAQDWGAALFYSEFLGRLPVDIRQWEPLTGMTTKALAARLGRSVDQLYDEFSPGDNWQLIGPSYVGDREHHRLIGDLAVAEARPFLLEIMQKARADVLRAFPAESCRRRATEWFDREQRRLEALLSECADGKLVDLYDRWLKAYLPGESVTVATASSLFATGSAAAATDFLDLFLQQYERAAAAYNEAIAETHSPLRPLKTSAGELPFFATMTRSGRAVRTGVFLDGEGVRVSGRGYRLASGRRLPVDELAAAGVRCLVGKAIVLVIQIRSGPRGGPLALPYRGSLYMPTAHRLADKLSQAGLLTEKLPPVVRVRFGLLDRLKSLDAPVRLPEHLVPAFGREEIPARELAANWASLSREAAERLEALREETGRRRWQKRNFPQLLESIEQLDGHRRQLARTDPKSQEIRLIGKRQKTLQVDLLERTVRQIHRDTQIREIDYWDSRGALMPWAVALGGEKFYDNLIAEAKGTTNG